MHIFPALLVILFMLSACGPSDSSANLELTNAGQSGLRTATERLLTTETGSVQKALPAVIAGVMTAFNISKPTDTINNIPSAPKGEELPGTSADTVLLKTLLELLGTDIRAILDRSSNREDALDTYLESLEGNTQRGELRLRAMVDTAEENEDTKTRTNRRIRDIRNEIDDVVEAGDSSGVARLTDELLKKQQAYAEADSELIVLEKLIEAYEDILKPLKERYNAINANREALLSGIKVIDMPGIESLQIIDYENGNLRVRSNSSRKSFFSF